jgi:6-phosphogluconolactonase
MELIIANVEELKAAITESFERLVADRRLACGLSGGGSALLFLGALRAARVDWSRVALFWVDERAVAPDHPASNFGVARRMLIDPLERHAPRAFRMRGEVDDLDEAVLDYEAALAHELDGEPLDLAILGVGEDGHVASLFPGHPALEERDARVVALTDAPRSPHKRLTLSLPFLTATRQIWILAVGERKRAVVQSALGRTEERTPLDMLIQKARDVTVFTDQVVRHR